MMLEFLTYEKQWANNIRGGEAPFTWKEPNAVFINPDVVKSIYLYFDSNGEEYVQIFGTGYVDINLRIPHREFRQEYWQVFGLPNPNPARYPEAEEEEDEEVDEPEN
jgi:hypothetical protein